MSRHNNPVNLALWESRQVWPALGQPDLVLSLGTGTGPQPKTAPDFRHIFRDGFGPRLFRHMMHSFEGDNPWRDLVNHLDKESRKDYIRLNISLPDMLPAIDDESQKEQYQESIQLQYPTQNDDINIASAFLISRFFFELDTLPQWTSGRYHCQGTIRCRLPGYTIAESMKRIQTAELSFVFESDTIGLVDWSNDICTSCHRYNKKVEFFVKDLVTSVTISLKNGSGNSRRLSAFPHSISWFIEQQGLDAVFGKADHGIPGGFNCHTCNVSSAGSMVKRKRIFTKRITRSAKRVRFLEDIATED